MPIADTLKENAVKLAVIFIICGFLNVLGEDVGFTECSRLYCGVIVLLWVLSIQERVTDVRLRNLLLLIAAQILLCSMLVIFRTQLFADSPLMQRWLWYVRYAPMMAIALLSLYLVLCAYRPAEKAVPAVCRVPVAVGVALTLGVITNDFHLQAFRFAEGVEAGYDSKIRAWLIYLFMTFLLLTVCLSCFILWKKRRRYCPEKNGYRSLLPIAIEIIYVILYACGADPQIKGIHLWDYGEIFCICTIAFLESGIQNGMIPANKDYDKLFSASSYPAVILDNGGSVVYKTAGAVYPFAEDEDTLIKRHDISGGSIEWTVNVKYTRMLTRQLVEATQQLEARNAYLAEGNRIKKETAETATRNRLYDRISRIIQRQLSEIDALLSDSDTPLAAKLPKIAVLKAYIKRRSNMELLAASGPLTAGELTAAISETLEYLRLCGVDTALSSFGAGAFPPGMIITAYERFEEVVEESLDTLSHINVSVRAEKDALILRVMLDAESFSLTAGSMRRQSGSFSCDVAVNKEGRDVNVTFTIAKGGERI